MDATQIVTDLVIAANTATLANIATLGIATTAAFGTATIAALSTGTDTVFEEWRAYYVIGTAAG
jgi:hypothetical protein